NHRPRPGHDRACKRSRVRIWLAGGPFCMGWSVRWPARPYKVGLSGSPVAWAARGLGHSRRLARAGPVGPRSLRPPAHRSPPRARPIARCGRARAPGLYRPRGLWHRWAMPTYLRADVGGGCGCICTYIYGRAALRCRQGRARAGQLVTSGASRVRLGVSRPGVGPWRAPANWSPPVPASVSLGQRLSMARALACRRPACPRGSRQL
ncbi:hypothetical protein KXX14_008398, partial [Aspergillus fumigatus]